MQQNKCCWLVVVVSVFHVDAVDGRTEVPGPVSIYAGPVGALRLVASLDLQLIYCAILRGS